MPPFVTATLTGLSALFFASGTAAATELPMVSEACPTLWEKDSPACPSPATLTWVDCPAVWPKDGKMALYFGTLHPMGWYNDTLPDWDRKTFEAAREGFFLDCEYGPKHLQSRQRQHLTLVVPGPIVQYGWHQGTQGRTFGLRVFKDRVSEPVESILPEPVSEATTLEGIGLGLLHKDIQANAVSLGYTYVSREGDPRVGIYRPGVVMEVVYDPASDRSREVIVRAGWQDHEIAALRRSAVQRFGFQWISAFERGAEKVWRSADDRIRIEFHPGDRPADSASLRLIKVRD